VTDFPTALFHVLHGSARPPVALCLYDVDADRKRYLQTIQSLMPVGERCETTFDVEAIFLKPALTLLVVPADELEALRELAGRREALLERTAPAILLIRKGSATQHLSDPEQAGLLSWLRSSILDPRRYEEIDVAEESKRFLKRTGRAPADFVRAFRLGELPSTLDNSLSYSDALLLTGADSAEPSTAEPTAEVAAPKTHLL